MLDPDQIENGCSVILGVPVLDNFVSSIFSVQFSHARTSCEVPVPIYSAP